VIFQLLIGERQLVAIAPGGIRKRSERKHHFTLQFDQCSVRVGVKQRRTHCEQMSSGLPLKADLARYNRHVSKVPIVLKKSFWGADQNCSGPLMPFAHGNMTDHIVSHKNDHEASHGRYAVLQW
jgi:hypothetical protein